MGQAVRDVLTVEQFLKLPEIKPALEFVQGRIVQKMSPGPAHSVLQGELYARIREHVRARKLGHAFPELRCTFGGESIVPDIVFFREGRSPRDAQGRLVDVVRLAPDLMIEILSPGQTIRDLSAKLARGVRNGVRLAWLIRPPRQRVHVFRAGQAVETLEAGAMLSGEDVLPEFRLPLAEMFGWLTNLGD